MRMRRKPWARPELAACPFCYDEYSNDPTQYRGRWRQQFARPEAPLWLELGCGKGGFVAQAALRWPQANFLAVDIKSEVLALAKRRVEAAFAAEGRPVENVKLIAQEICLIERLLDENDAVGRIFINFCNPWPKEYHNKRRLTHPRQLLLYRQFLADGGEIRFKTDDDDLFDASLQYFPDAGFEILWQTRDLHAQEPEWNLRTEHEQMFSEQGIPIKALIARKLPQLPDNEATRDAIASLRAHPAQNKSPQQAQ